MYVREMGAGEEEEGGSFTRIFDKCNLPRKQLLPWCPLSDHAVNPHKDAEKRIDYCVQPMDLI